MHGSRPGSAGVAAAVVVAAALFAAVPAASAAVISIDSYDNGAYRNDGLHSGGNTTTFTGFTAFGGSPFPAAYENRGFYAFDISGVGTASAISVTFYARGTFVTDTGTETVVVTDYTVGTVAALVGGSTVVNPFGDQAFADLGDGVVGTHTITARTSTPMPEITIDLAPGFVSLFNNALQTEQKIALGTALTSGAYFTPQGFWGAGGGIPAARLNVTLQQTVPEPSTALLAGVAVLGLALTRRRRAP